MAADDLAHKMARLDAAVQAKREEAKRDLQAKWDMIRTEEPGFAKLMLDLYSAFGKVEVVWLKKEGRGRIV